MDRGGAVKKTTAIASAEDLAGALNEMWTIFEPARRTMPGRWIMWWIEREAAMLLDEPEPSMENAFRMIGQQFARDLSRLFDSPKKKKKRKKRRGHWQARLRSSVAKGS